jgi:hypothetical protein
MMLGQVAQGCHLSLDGTSPDVIIKSTLDSSSPEAPVSDERREGKHGLEKGGFRIPSSLKLRRGEQVRNDGL